MFEISLKMRLICYTDSHPDFFNVQMRGFQKFTRLLQSEIIYILYNTGLDFLFEKMLETGNGQIDRSRQITDNQLLGDVVFDLPEYLLYPVIHPLAAEEKKRAVKIEKVVTVNFSFQ